MRTLRSMRRNVLSGAPTIEGKWNCFCRRCLSYAWAYVRNCPEKAIRLSRRAKSFAADKWKTFIYVEQW